MGRVLGVCRRGVLEVLQGFADSVGHEYVDVTDGAIPVDFQAAVLAARWVDGDCIIFSERIEEVGGIVCGEELDTDIICSKGEGSGQGCVCPKAGGYAPRGRIHGVGGCGRGACRR